MSYREYKMTYEKPPKDDKSVERRHTHLDLGDEPIRTPERVRYLVANHPKHKELKKQGWRVAQFGKHDDRAESFGRKVVFVKEETEQLDELSKEKLQPVADRAAKRRKIVPFMGAVARMSGYYMPKKNLKITPGGGEYRWSSPYSGKKSMKEETEQLDEDARSLRSNLIRQIYEAEYALKKGDNPWKVWKKTRGETGQSWAEFKSKQTSQTVGEKSSRRLAVGHKINLPDTKKSSESPKAPKWEKTPVTPEIKAKVAGQGTLHDTKPSSTTVGAGPAGIHINPSPSRGPGTLAKPPTSSVSTVPGATRGVSRDIGPTSSLSSIAGVPRIIGNSPTNTPLLNPSTPSDTVTATSQHTGKEITFPSKLGPGLTGAWNRSVRPSRRIPEETLPMQYGGEYSVRRIYMEEKIAGVRKLGPDGNYLDEPFPAEEPEEDADKS